MKRQDILEKLVKAGVVSVVRANSGEKAIEIVDAVILGEVTAIELTYSIPRAHEVIADLVEKYSGTEVVIGAGTVLDAVSARLAILAGAQFIVSPCFDLEVAKLCNLYQIPYIPGFMTAKEAKIALEFGSEIIKLFPGDIAGCKMIKDLKGPFPQANIMPSGGVSIDNVGEWLKAGAVAVSAGSAMTKGTSIEISKKARAFHQAYLNAND